VRQRCATVGAECTAAAREVAPRTSGTDTDRRRGRPLRCADYVAALVRDAREMVRLQPLVLAPAVPRVSKDNFRKAMHERAGGRVTPYDLRRAFSRWMERAGVVRIRRKIYMGHAAGDVTALYEQSDIDAYLAEDAATLRKWLHIADQETATAVQPLRKVN